MKTTPSKFKPFVLVTEEKTDNQNANGKVKIACGRAIISPCEFDNEAQAEKYLQTQPYETFINLYAVLKYYENEDKKQNPQNVEENQETTI